MFTVADHGPMQAQYIQYILYIHRCSRLTALSSPTSTRIEWHFSQFRYFFFFFCARENVSRESIHLDGEHAGAAIYHLPFSLGLIKSVPKSIQFFTRYGPLHPSPRVANKYFRYGQCYTRNFGYPIIRCMCLLCMCTASINI